MVIDSSAIIDLAIKGPTHDAVRRALSSAVGARVISAVSWVECHIVARRKFGDVGYARASSDLDALLRACAMQIWPVSVSHARIAIDAFNRFGKGAGGGARNFGDCFSYALAKHHDDDLLFVGEDFKRTDVKVAKR
jgi:ribonuclease VapC